MQKDAAVLLFVGTVLLSIPTLPVFPCGIFENRRVVARAMAILLARGVAVAFAISGFRACLFTPAHARSIKSPSLDWVRQDLVCLHYQPVSLEPLHMWYITSMAASIRMVELDQFIELVLGVCSVPREVEDVVWGRSKGHGTTRPVHIVSELVRLGFGVGITSHVCRRFAFEPFAGGGGIAGTTLPQVVRHRQ